MLEKQVLSVVVSHLRYPCVRLWDSRVLQANMVSFGHLGPPKLILGTSVRSLFRSRVEKKLAHLARRIAGNGTLARPRECLVHVGGFQYPETAYVLLGLSVRPIGDEHRTIRLLPHRLCAGD